MTVSTVSKIISKTIHTTVNLGSGLYSSPLTIAATGAIAPRGVGATALFAAASLGTVSVINEGRIDGGNGANGVRGVGGIGVDLAAVATLSNSGTITGGNGGTGRYGHGGIGVYLAAGGTLINSGHISGGDGGNGRAVGNAGAAGVYLAGGALTNSGTIAGGTGGSASGVNGIGGSGGDGVYLAAAATLNNTGLIIGNSGNAGNAGGGTGGAAVYLANSGTITNEGVIAGGVGGSSATGYGGYGGAGIYLGSGGVVNNSGIITGGNGGTSTYPAGGLGGAGVDLANGGTLTNTGTIEGGNGGKSSTGSGGNGGAGVYISGGTLVNAGTISGGTGGTGEIGNGAAGYAVQFGAAVGTLVIDPGAVFNGVVLADASVPDVLELGGTTAATLTGLGTNFVGFYNVVVAAKAYWTLGGTSSVYSAFTVDGTLVVNDTILENLTVASGGTLINQAGTIASSVYGVGGAMNVINNSTISSPSGYGLNIAAGGTVSNTANARIVGTITGIEVTGTSSVTVIDTGLIEGGAGGEAIQFGAGNDRLVLDDGYNLVGNVDGGAGSNTLELDNSPGSAVVSGLGTSFTNFTTLQVDAGFKWSLIDANTLGAGSVINDAGTLSVVGTLTDAGAATISDGATLEIGGPGSLQIDSATLAGGILQGGGAGVLAIGSSLNGAATGVVTVESNGTLSGFGTITGVDLVDNGTVAAEGGTLTLATSASGTGALTIGAGNTVVANNTLSVASVVFGIGGNELLSLGNPKAMTSTISGFGSGDVIDLKNLVATTLNFVSGTLSLERGTYVVTTLLFAGSYTNADFALAPDGNGGTDLSFAGPDIMLDNDAFLRHDGGVQAPGSSWGDAEWHTDDVAWMLDGHFHGLP